MIERIPTVTFTMRDISGSSATTRFNVRQSTPVGIAMPAADGLRSLLASITASNIVRQSVTYSVVYEDNTRPGASGSMLRSAIFVFETTQANEYAIVSLPGIKDEYLVSTGDRAGIAVDIENPAVVSFVDAIIGDYCNEWGYGIVSLAATLVSRTL